MTKIGALFFLGSVLGLAISFESNSNAQNENHNKPKIAFTFDDGSINDIGNYKLKTWNQFILDHLKKHQLKAILFSSGANKTNEKGKYVLTSWNNAGHLIGNHTFSHPNFNNKNTSLEDFKRELTQNDKIIKQYFNYYPYFRFPYLKEGNTKEKIDGFRRFLKQKGYKNGYVSVDASDWYINGRLVQRLTENPHADVSGFRDYYKNHLFHRAQFYDSLAFQLTDRRINHVLLLHHNLAAALFLDDLIQHFQENGWEVINADEAYTDKIYNEVPTPIPAGRKPDLGFSQTIGKV